MKRSVTILVCCFALAQAQIILQPLYFQISRDSTHLLVLTRDGDTVWTSADDTTPYSDTAGYAKTLQGLDTTGVWIHAGTDSAATQKGVSGVFSGSVAICSTAVRSGYELFVKGDAAVSGDASVDGNLKGATVTFGDTIYIRTQGRLTLPYRFATVYDSTTTDEDTIDLVNYSHVGDNISIMDISSVASSGPDDVQIYDGATKIATLSARNKYIRLVRASDGSLRVWGSN